MLKLFKDPIDISFPSFSFWVFWLAYCLPHLFSTASGSCEVNHLPLIVFDKCPREKVLHTEWALESGLIKRVLQVGSSREPPDRSNNNSLGMRLWRSSNTFQPPLVAARLMVFTMIVGSQFPRLLPLPVLVNKVLLELNHAHSFMYSLWLLLCLQQ